MDQEAVCQTLIGGNAMQKGTTATTTGGVTVYGSFEEVNERTITNSNAKGELQRPANGAQQS